MKIFSKKKSDAPRRRSNRDVVKPSSSPHIFKRNRTLTGTTSNRLDSSSPNADLNSSRTHVHRLSIQRRKISAVLVVVLIMAIPVWLLISNFTATVSVGLTNVGISKNVDMRKYQNSIQDYLDQNPLSRLTFFLNQSNLSDFVTAKLPEVSSVTQSRAVGIGTTSFAITMRTPVAGWQINNKQYFVDSKGIPFQQNYFLPPSVQIVDNSGIAYKLGTTAIASNRFLSFIGRVVSGVKTNGYTVIQAVLPPNTTRELDIRLKEVNYYIKLSIDRPAGEQVEDMVTAIRYFSMHGQTPQYIDVRVSGKAFYR
jgi:cell division septal protein FtsQ